MPSKRIYLDSAKTELISVRWGPFWKNFTAEYNGELIGRLHSAQTLKEGSDFTLPDGRVLTARARQFTGVELLLDGQPLPGSVTHPREQIKQAFYVLLFLSLTNIAIGVAKMTGSIGFSMQPAEGSGYVLFGLIYLGLGWWAKSKASAVALYLAIGLYIGDYVLTIALADGGSTSSTSGLFMRIAFSLILYRGIVGAKSIKADKEQTTTTEADYAV